MPRYNSRKTLVRMEGAGGNGISAGPGPGDFSHGDINSGNTEKIRVDDRGQFEGHVEGNDLDQEYSITVGVQPKTLTSLLEARITDFVMRTGVFTKTTGILATQTVSPNPDVWAWKTIVTMTLGANVATFTLPHCIGGYGFSAAMEGNSLAISGVNNGNITRT